MPGLIDVAPMGVIGSPDAPPLIVRVRVMIIEGFVIAATVNALVLLRQQSRRLA